MTTNNISNSAIIHPLVKRGTGNIIKHGVIIHAGVTIGNNNYIGEYTTIGTPPEHRNPKCVGTIEIGSNNVIREYVSINLPADTILTKIGDDNYIMNKTHIGHDAKVGSHCNIAPFSTIGGSVKIDDYVTIGINVSIHQFRKVGRGAMLGMGAIITKNVKEYRKIINANQILGFNIVGMKRMGLTEKEIYDIINNQKA